MFWPVLHLSFPHVTPSPSNAFLSADITTIQEYRSLHPHPLLWDNATVTKQKDETYFVIYCLYRDIRVYIKTGNVNKEKMTALLKLASTNKDPGIVAIIASIRLEFEANELVHEMNSHDIVISHLTNEFFDTRIAKIARVKEGLTNMSIIHTHVHTNCVTAILNMYELGQNMMHHFNLSYRIDATDYEIVTHIEDSLYFKAKIAACHCINNPFICYYMQTAPLALWLMDAIKFVDTANLYYGCLPCSIEPQTVVKKMNKLKKVPA